MGSDLLYWVIIGAVGVFASALTIATAFKRKGKGYYLCDDCRFNSPQDCLKTERPYALQCTSYRADVSGQAPALATSDSSTEPALVTSNDESQSSKESEEKSETIESPTSKESE